MRKIMRPRYYCEFCNKAGGSGGHIRRHEERCTLNPSRVCGMCNVLGQKQPELSLLLAILPSKDEQRMEEEGGLVHFKNVPEEVIKKLREAAGGCPACMLAALRQRGLPVPTAEAFNFTEECKSVWADINEAAYHRDYMYG